MKNGNGFRKLQTSRVSNITLFFFVHFWAIAYNMKFKLLILDDNLIFSHITYKWSMQVNM